MNKIYEINNHIYFTCEYQIDDIEYAFNQD